MGWISGQKLVILAESFGARARELHIKLAYKAVMSAFGTFLIGTDSSNLLPPVPPYSLLPPSNYGLVDLNFGEVDKTAEGLEQLFQNITLSLFSVKEFWFVEVYPILIVS